MKNEEDRSKSEEEFNLSERISELFEVEYLDSMADVQGDVSIILKEFIIRIQVKVLMDWKGQNDFIDYLKKISGKELVK